MKLSRVPFAPGERYDLMWDCCGGTHQGSWQNNGNDYYAGVGTKVVAPIAGVVVRAGVPPMGQGQRVGIQGSAGAVYLAHMTNLKVNVGDVVNVGDPVGEIWDFPGLPSHLHFSAADGTYDGGRFSNPWAQVVALGNHISGRTYEAPGARPDKPAKPKPDPTPWAIELLPEKMKDGFGPTVLGPWKDTPASRKKRSATVDKKRAAGIDAREMSAKGSLYIYVYPGPIGPKGLFRWGGFKTKAQTQAAEKKLLRSGQLKGRYRIFKGKSNSMYPYL